ncbi:hypothetical protein N6G06_26735, partial [Cupriavidus gilardii]|uniref:hypothetical protein n=1 Tax=Cupriavidus gilardii TaxID=82541 RepID=UPI0021BFF31A
LTAMLLHQSNGTLTDFRRKFVVLAHGSIFSKVGASSKPGAIHSDVMLTETRTVSVSTELLWFNARISSRAPKSLEETDAPGSEEASP